MKHISCVLCCDIQLRTITLTHDVFHELSLRSVKLEGLRSVWTSYYTATSLTPRQRKCARPSSQGPHNSFDNCPKNKYHVSLSCETFENASPRSTQPRAVPLRKVWQSPPLRWLQILIACCVFFTKSLISSTSSQSALPRLFMYQQETL